MSVITSPFRSTGHRRKPARGVFITLEGVDGAGKSSHVQWLATQLADAGVPVLCTREPGGTPLGEQLRSLLLHTPMHPATETLLMFAARNEHLETVIKPALQAGTWVICDRFTDATYAYQGGGRGQDDARIRVLEDWVQAGLQPDCTLLFDVPLETARARLDNERDRDRFEHEQAAFFERTREIYLQRARQWPERIRIIDGRHSIADTRKLLAGPVQALLAERWAPGMPGQGDHG